MFTGLVRHLGRIADDSGAARLVFACADPGAAGWRAGDSVAVSGVCLTVEPLGNGRFAAELSPETRARTTLGRLGAGTAVNLEPALRAADALGGHLVTGHVDGVARVLTAEEDGNALRAWLEAPRPLARFLAPKGSVALDGVSLTVADLEGARFAVDVVPHTRAVTTLAGLAPGVELNLEVDLVARYLDRLLAARSGA